MNLRGDGAAERQILLMKLVHEFENAPEFGAAYIANASSDQQRWIARLGALMSRVSLEHGASFKASAATSVQFWRVSRESFRKGALAAIEELKLELELDGRDQIGHVYDSNRQYDFLRDLKAVIGNAATDLLLIDPYFDGAAFQTYLESHQGTRSIRILCSRYANDVAAYISAFGDQTGTAPELRKSRNLHDRLVVIDRADCWIVGGSIKDAGKKPTYLVPLQPAIASQKIDIYEALWQDAELVGRSA